jgi:hypothetical protein
LNKNPAEKNIFMGDMTILDEITNWLRLMPCVVASNGPCLTTIISQTPEWFELCGRSEEELDWILADHHDNPESQKILTQVISRLTRYLCMGRPTTKQWSQLRALIKQGGNPWEVPRTGLRVETPEFGRWTISPEWFALTARWGNITYLFQLDHPFWLPTPVKYTCPRCTNPLGDLGDLGDPAGSTYCKHCSVKVNPKGQYRMDPPALSPIKVIIQGYHKGDHTSWVQVLEEFERRGVTISPEVIVKKAPDEHLTI